MNWIMLSVILGSTQMPNNEKYPMLQSADIIDENNQLTTLGEYYASHNSNNNLSNYNQKLDVS